MPHHTCLFPALPRLLPSFPSFYSLRNSTTPCPTCLGSCPYLPHMVIYGHSYPTCPSPLQFIPHTIPSCSLCVCGELPCLAGMYLPSLLPVPYCVPSTYLFPLPAIPSCIPVPSGMDDSSFISQDLDGSDSSPSGRDGMGWGVVLPCDSPTSCNPLPPACHHPMDVAILPFPISVAGSTPPTIALFLIALEGGRLPALPPCPHPCLHSACCCFPFPPSPCSDALCRCSVPLHTFAIYLGGGGYPTPCLPTCLIPFCPPFAPTMPASHTLGTFPLFPCLPAYL